MTKNITILYTKNFISYYYKIFKFHNKQKLLHFMIY